LGTRDFVLKGEREIAAARGEVEHTSRIPFRDNLGCPSAPEEIPAKAQKVVREVVSSRDAIKHFPYNFGITCTGVFLRRAQPPAFARKPPLCK